MTLDVVFNQLKISIENLLSSTGSCGEITRESDLFQHGLDSLSVMQLLVELESQFNIVFNDDELSPELFEKASNLAERISSKVNQSSAPH